MSSLAEAVGGDGGQPAAPREGQGDRGGSGETQGEGRRAGAVTVEDLPKVQATHVRMCALPSWYCIPALSRRTVRSVVIPVPDKFLEYMHCDGIVLPRVPAGIKVDSNDPRFEGVSGWSSSSDDEGGDFEDDMKNTTNGTESNGDEEDEEDAVFCFPQLEEKIRAGIEDLGGHVFPKFDWSAPRDAAFLHGGNMKCETPGEVFLLLKGSDFVAHDLYHAFDGCEEVGSEKKEAKTANADNTTSKNNARNNAGYRYHIVLRSWCNLYPSQEFRCIVAHGKIIGISQRHCDRCFPALGKDDRMLLVKNKIVEFFYQVLRPNLSMHGFAPCYVFDAYLSRSDKVTLIDIGVFHPGTSDLKLFSWKEIAGMVRSSAEAEGDQEEGDAHSRVEIRYVRSEAEALPSQLAAHRVPADFVGDPESFIENFVDAFRSGKIDSEGAGSS